MLQQAAGPVLAEETRASSLARGAETLVEGQRLSDGQDPRSILGSSTPPSHDAYAHEATGGTSVSISIGPDGPTFSQKELEFELDLSAMPEFQIAANPIEDDLEAALPDLAVMLFILSGSLVGTYGAVRRYDPR